MELKKEERLRAVACYSASILGFGALGSSFLPLLKMETAGGEWIYFQSFPIFFGGEESFALSDSTYFFDFGINIYLLVALQLFLLGGLSTALGRKSPRNLLFGFVLYTGASAMAGLTPIWTRMVNPAITSSGLHLAYGYFLMLAFAVLALGATALSLVMSRHRRPPKAE